MRVYALRQRFLDSPNFFYDYLWCGSEFPFSGFGNKWARYEGSFEIIKTEQHKGVSPYPLLTVEVSLEQLLTCNDPYIREWAMTLVEVA